MTGKHLAWKGLKITACIMSAIILSWAFTEPPPGGWDTSVNHPVPSKIVRETPFWFDLDSGWKCGRTKIVFENGDWRYE